MGCVRIVFGRAALVGTRAAIVVFVEACDKSQDRTHTHPRAVVAARSWPSHTQVSAAFGRSPLSGRETSLKNTVIVYMRSQ